MCWCTGRDEIKNEDIRNEVRVTLLEDKMRAARRWFKYVRGDARMPLYGDVRLTMDGFRRCRFRLNKS